MRRTKTEAAATRAGLLDAALVVFNRLGYADARLEDIAQEAGVTRGAIYHHFGGKVEIYDALLQERFARANQVWEEVSAQAGTPLERIRRLLLHPLRYLAADVDYRAVQELVIFKTGYVAELAGGLRRKQESTRQLVEHLTNLIAEGIHTGELRPDLSPRDGALALLGVLNGVSLMWLVDPQLFSLQARAEGIVDSCLRGLVKDR